MGLQGQIHSKLLGIHQNLQDQIHQNQEKKTTILGLGLEKPHLYVDVAEGVNFWWFQNPDPTVVGGFTVALKLLDVNFSNGTVLKTIWAKVLPSNLHAKLL